MEEEFKLPEKWCILRTPETAAIINQWFRDNNYGNPYMNKWYIAILDRYINTFRSDIDKHPDFTEITFDQFMNYVVNPKPIIKPLPKYQILDKEITYTGLLIKQCVNSEGSVFEINDWVKTLNKNVPIKPGQITGFRFSKDGENICAIYSTAQYGVSIDKLEHCIDIPKIETIQDYTDIVTNMITDEPDIILPFIDYIDVIRPETNLERARREFPIGMRFRSVFNESYIASGIPTIDNNTIYILDEYGSDRCIYWSERNQWATPLGMETNMEKAQRLYPSGTRVRSLVNTVDISNGIIRHGDRLPEIFMNRLGDMGSLMVFDGTRWAEILTE